MNCQHMTDRLVDEKKTETVMDGRGPRDW